jgi:NAD(P)-dependent dehydrogenase (short-subunit alcohol dehydrogenase family)
MSELFPPGAALVVGGTGGIGRAVALEFARAGTDVAVIYRSNAAAAAEVAQALRELGRAATCHQADVTEPGQIEAALGEIVRTHGRVHTIVFGAGPLVEQKYLAEVSASAWRAALDIEASGFLNVFQASVRRLRDWGGGSFVHLGSAGALSWPKRDGLSVVPKAANEALIRGIAREEGRFGIRANSVLIGVIEAGMFLKLKERGEIDRQWMDNTLGLLALKRFGKPEDVGHAAVFLASARGAYITGQQISVAGGYGV